MKIGAVIVARMGSSRFPGKSLAALAGRPSLEWLIRRVRRAPSIETVVVATTVRPEDHAIADLAATLGITCYRGSEDDVMGRVLEAAQSCGMDVVVHLTGDCPLADPRIIEQTVARFLADGADYAKNFQCGQEARSERSFPNGLDVEVFRTSCLADVAAATSDPWLREHVTEPLYTWPQFSTVTLVAPPNLAHPELRLCIDTPEDHELLARIFEHFRSCAEEVSAEQVVAYLTDHPELQHINASVKQRKFTAAVIGLGRIGSLYDVDPKMQGINTHSGAYMRWSKTRLAGGADPEPQRREAFAHQWNQEAVFASPEMMLAELRPEVVSICSPSHLHACHVRLCLEHGVQAILCEKPFVKDKADGESLIAACIDAGVPLAVNHWLRYSDLYQGLRAFLAAGGLGKIWGGRYHYSKGLYNSGSHAVDILRFLLGEVAAVRATDTRSTDLVEPNIGGVLHFESGAVIHLTVGDYRCHFTTELELEGAQGRLRISDNERRVELFEAVDSDHESGVRELAPAEVVPFPTGRGDFMVKAVANLIDALEDRAALICTAQDGLAAVRTLGALEKSSKNDGSYERI